MLIQFRVLRTVVRSTMKSKRGLKKMCLHLFAFEIQSYVYVNKYETVNENPHFLAKENLFFL